MRQQDAPEEPAQLDLFAQFNGVPKDADKTDFYRHDQNWSNRMILGDSLQVMASLAEREGLRGKVQCIYLDPPYGIKFNSNFQWSTTSRDVKDGNAYQITREPEQVKAFRDTWRDGIHSYLTYLRDRLTVAWDLLTESGSIFVQIGDENVHRIRSVLDEVFGNANFCQLIPFRKKLMPLGATLLEGMCDYLIWYAKDIAAVKFRHLYRPTEMTYEGRWRNVELEDGTRRRLTGSEARSLATLPEKSKVYRLVSQRTPSFSPQNVFDFPFCGRVFKAPGCWVCSKENMNRLHEANRLEGAGDTLSYIYFNTDFPYSKVNNMWSDTYPAQDKEYVVQTSTFVIQRCLMMTTDPGDLVLDPTCGSGTTATVAEQWGRRWITIDTSRVALALARARIMGARYPYYLLADSREGQQKEAEVTRTAVSTQPVHNSIRHGFVYERVPHVTLKSIANNAEIDVIWESWQAKLEPLREALNKASKQKWQEWEIPREAESSWSAAAKKLHADWWQARISRQKEIDASIAAKAEFEYLYDKPYEDRSRVRVAGPFTVESLSPHRVLAVDENDELIDGAADRGGKFGDAKQSFTQMILDSLKLAGVQQAHKQDRISFTALTAWPGRLVCADGRYLEGSKEKRAAIFIGPEFGTVQRADLVEAAKEAGDADFDVLIACAFNYEAHTTEFEKLGRLPVLIRETIKEIVVPVHVERATPAVPKPPLFKDIADDTLLGFGVPKDWLADVRAATEDTLLVLADHLPGEAAEALLELATGGKSIPAKVEPIPGPFAHPDAQRRFRVMANVEELERALEFPWDRWTVFLHPAQRQLVERDFSGAARVSGSAGTGKTIVALHRAVFLARANPDARVLLTTFSETLANALRVRLRRLISNEPRLAERLEVHAIDAIGQRLYVANQGQAKIASDDDVRTLVTAASGEIGGHKFSIPFLLAEWVQIVDAWQIENWEGYRDVPRLGRKTRLSDKQRVALWAIFERVQTGLSKAGLVTRAGMLTKVAAVVGASKRPPFDFAVVDEAQDIGVPHLRFLAALGAGRRNALFFAGDLGQRIFQPAFSWRSLGVEIRGRSSTLRVNYRTSHQIRMQADRLLDTEVTDADGNAESRAGTVSVFNGPAPEVAVCDSLEQEEKHASAWLSQRLAEGVVPHEIAIFVRSTAELGRASAAAQAAGVPWKLLDERVDTAFGHVSISTMHLAKGLEFKAVAVMACDDEVVPLQSRIESITDEADLEEVYTTERHLLYVACTRARDHLLITCVAPASEFLDDMTQQRGAKP